MPFEIVEALAPEHPIGLEPVVELPERLGAELVPAPLCVAADPNEAGFAQYTQMLGNSGLAQPELRDELPNRASPLAEKIENTSTRRLRNDCERRHGQIIAHGLYTCQGIY